MYNFDEIEQRVEVPQINHEVNEEKNCIEQPAEQESVEAEEEDSDEDEFDLKFPQEYHGKNPPKLVDEIKGHDGKV